MSHVSTIPSNDTRGIYNIFISGFDDDSSEGGQICSTVEIVDDPEEKDFTDEESVDDFQASSFEDAIRKILRANNGEMCSPSYHSLDIDIKFNGKDIEEECTKLLKESIKLKSTLPEQEYNSWCAFVVDELNKKNFCLKQSTIWLLKF